MDKKTLPYLALASFRTGTHHPGIIGVQRQMYCDVETSVTPVAWTFMSEILANHFGIAEPPSRHKILGRCC